MDYTTREWREARERVLERDRFTCQAGRLAGGPCHPTLDVHHVVPVEHGGALYDTANLVTLCHAHHPMVEALRRRAGRWRSCTHHHPYPGGRAACERRLNSRSIVVG